MNNGASFTLLNHIGENMIRGRRYAVVRFVHIGNEGCTITPFDVGRMDSVLYISPSEIEETA